jgi:hypothetical protein
MRRVVVVAAGALIVCAAAVVGGRWETHRFERSEGARMRAVWQLVSHSQPAAYRLAAPVDCLLYARGKDPFALEVCFDSAGRLVDVIDRRDPANSKRWSLRFDTGAAPLTVAPARLLKIFQRIGGLRGYRGATYLPMPQEDLGPTLALGRT